MPARLACLAATLCYGLAGIYGRRFEGNSPIITAGQLSGGKIAFAESQPSATAHPGADQRMMAQPDQ